MRTRGLIAVTMLVSVAAVCCLSARFSPAAQSNSTDSDVPLFDGLGTFGRKVQTSSSEAQKYFDQGLCFLYAFNHDEAIRSFRRALEFDPKLAMGWWGIAIANGPHINNPIVDPTRARAAWDALAKARDVAAGASPVELALIKALHTRYADPQPDDRTPLDRAFADAMRTVWKSFPDDPDVGAIFAESLMDLRPWDLWTPDGTARPGTPEVVETLETVLKLSPNHPLALHLYVHAIEASPHPERADEPSDRLRNLQPGLGHLVHMPSHIDVRRGRWRMASEANLKAIQADRKYREQSPRQNFYRVYMAHNHHMLAYAAIMQGESKQAIDAIQQMTDGIPASWIQENAPIADGFTAMPLEVRVRFGRWEEILQAPEPAEYLPIARAMRHYARGVALTATGRLNDAKAEQRAFSSAAEKVPSTAQFGNNLGVDLVRVADRLLDGEILYRDGKTDEAIEALRESVRREDRLKYDEPPAWIHPVRHVLGATLLQEGRSSEAEQVYRDDLRRLPNNGWSLWGLSRALELQNKMTEAAEINRQFQTVWARADVKLTSSCFCLPGR